MSNEKAYRLLGILLGYAPNSKAQEACTKLYNDAQFHGAYGRDLEQVMIDVMSDGLKYGNWPWKTTQEKEV